MRIRLLERSFPVRRAATIVAKIGLGIIVAYVALMGLALLYIVVLFSGFD
jgi:hypothetical protein